MKRFGPGPGSNRGPLDLKIRALPLEEEFRFEEEVTSALPLCCGVNHHVYLKLSSYFRMMLKMADEESRCDKE